MLRRTGFEHVAVGPAVDVFAGAGGEANARAFSVYGYAFRAVRPG
ncbi:MAG: hypothetical protein OEY23_24135 [Acidimicrobiia bacterium]|nr:hypothetical protein [Acidimicrobiia bacterium]